VLRVRDYEAFNPVALGTQYDHLEAFMGHNDPALSYLKHYGYSVVRLPRADIRPLLLVEREGKDLSRLGATETVFIPGVKPLPRIQEDVRAADIKGSIKTTLSLGLGLALLKNFLEAFGATGAGLDLAYTKAKTVTFEFTGLLSDTINLTELDQFLAAANEDPNSRHLQALLEADAVYCVATTLKSKSFLLDAAAERGTKLEVDVPAIKQAVSGNVTVEGTSNSTSTVSYTGDKLLIFGVQAVQLFYANGQYRAFRPTPAGDVVLRKAGKRARASAKSAKGSKSRSFLIPEGAFLSLL
jgi:hypothetical protein